MKNSKVLKAVAASQSSTRQKRHRKKLCVASVASDASFLQFRCLLKRPGATPVKTNVARKAYTFYTPSTKAAVGVTQDVLCSTVFYTFRFATKHFLQFPIEVKQRILNVGSLYLHYWVFPIYAEKRTSVQQAYSLTKQDAALEAFHGLCSQTCSCKRCKCRYLRGEFGCVFLVGRIHKGGL